MLSSMAAPKRVGMVVVYSSGFVRPFVEVHVDSRQLVVTQEGSLWECLTEFAEQEDLDEILIDPAVRGLILKVARAEEWPGIEEEPE